MIRGRLEMTAVKVVEMDIVAEGLEKTVNCGLNEMR